MADIGPLGVVITAKEVYDLVLETKAAVTRIEQQVSEMVKTVDNHEHAIDDLTKKYYMAGGIGGVIGTIIASLVPLITRLFGG